MEVKQYGGDNDWNNRDNTFFVRQWVHDFDVQKGKNYVIVLISK